MARNVAAVLRELAADGLQIVDDDGSPFLRRPFRDALRHDGNSIGMRIGQKVPHPLLLRLPDQRAANVLKRDAGW